MSLSEDKRHGLAETVMRPVRRQCSPDVRKDNDVCRGDKEIQRAYVDMHMPSLFGGSGWSDSHHLSSAGIDIQNLVTL